MITLQELEERFDGQLRTVDELILFDRFILDFCVMHIESLNTRLKDGPFNIINPTYLAENTLQAIKNVRQNDSLRIYYSSMFNSCLVLQVSYFTSIIEAVFKCACFWLYSNQGRDDLNKEVLKKTNDIKFQDMSSIKKTFQKYLSIEIEDNSITNTVILAQLSRHAIVHSLSRADGKFIIKIKTAAPRDIKQNITRDEIIQFTSTELDYVKLSMQQFISTLCEKIKQKYSLH